MKVMTRTFALMTAIFFALLIVGVVYGQETSPININTAGVDELTQLKGVGPTYAAKIVQYREANGPFKTPEELMSVPGIGQRTLELNKDRIVVAVPAKKTSVK
jgi:competence protein ComEA